MNNFNDMSNLKFDMERQIKQLQDDTDRLINEQKQKVNEMKEDRELIGRDLYYIPTWIDDEADVRKGIIKTKHGTFYRHKRDIPPGLESMAVNAKYSETALGILSARFRSIYLIVPSDESIEDQFTNQSEYIVEDQELASELMRYLIFNERNVELEGNRILIYENAPEVLEEIQEFINNKRRNQMMSMMNDDDDDNYATEINYISGDTEI